MYTRTNNLDRHGKVAHRMLHPHDENKASGNYPLLCSIIVELWQTYPFFGESLKNFYCQIENVLELA